MVSNSSSFYQGLETLLAIKLGWMIEKRNRDALSHLHTLPDLVILDNSALSHIVIESLLQLKSGGSKIVIFDIDDFCRPKELYLFNAFLKKSMPTDELISVLQDVVEYGDTYVHSETGIYFLNNYTKLLKESK